MEEIFLHPGFRFSPRDSELVEFYLKPKILGQELPCKIIQERQVFGANANPWQVFDTERDSWIVSEDESEKVMYVFTHITKKANSTIDKKRSTKEGSVRENFVKKAGCGTWSGKQGPEQVKDDKDRVIGEKRYLVFEINEIGDDFDFNKVRGCYRMHYYTLFGVEQEIVLCRITLDLSKKTPLKLKQAKVDESTNDEKNQKKSNKNTKKITKARKNKKINKSESLVISCETNVNLGSAKGVYRCDITGQYQDDIVEIVNSTPDNKVCGIEGTDDKRLQEEYIGAITANTRDLIVYTERQGVVEDGDGSQVMVNNCYQEDDIASIWNTLPTPNLDDMIVNDNVIAGYFDETNETSCDSALCGVGDDGLYMSEVLNTISEIPSTSFDPAVDPHEVDLYFDIEALLKDLNSRGEEPAIFENSRSKLLGKRKVVAEGPQEAKRLCL